MAERCQGFVDDMNSQEMNTGTRTRALKEKDKLAREASARMLMANLYQQWKVDPKSTVGVMRTKNWYSGRREEIGPNITCRGVTSFLDYLSGRHLFEIVSEGRKHPDAREGIPTQVRAKQGLIDYLEQGDVSSFDLSRTYPPIILKASRAEGKKPLRLERNEVTEKLEAGVNRINALLLKRSADLQIPDADMAKLREEGINLPSRLYTHRTVYRVFNNGSFDQGGRFYGGWWQQIPSRLRQHITINGMPTVEMDYSALHPRLIYAERGIQYEGDPYDVGLDESLRPLVKVTFQKLINGVGYPRHPRPGSDEPPFDAVEMGMSWRQFVDTIKDHHSSISDLFGAGIGLRLQRKDSDITQAVMLEFNDFGAVMLPVHDSFIVSGLDLGFLQLAMDQSMEKHSGIRVPIKIKENDQALPNMNPELAKHWDEYDSYNPAAERHVEPRLTGQFVDGYSAYQERVGQAVRQHHELTF
jgi:hypothetical protein